MSTIRLFSVFTLIAAFAGPLAAGAQTPPPPPAGDSAPPAPGDSAPPMAGSHHRHRHHPSLTHALHAVNLTDAQKQQIATFRDQEKKANFNADPATKKANGAKMRQQIMGILTPDQKTQLTNEMHRSATRAPGNGPAPAPSASPQTK